MAGNNQPAILPHGLEAWNKWRKENPDVSIDLKNARLMHMNLENADQAEADLKEANLSSVVYDQKILWPLAKTARFNLKKLWHQRDDILLDTTIRGKGVTAAICYGSQQFKLFLQDQDFLEEFLEKKWGRKIFYIWWVLADCGRSSGRWAGGSFLLALLFAFLYWDLGSSSFETQHLEFNFLNMFYCSVVTFTTLGFGDIIPKTTTAAMCVTIEVILGYVMLGGLVTIFASKLLHRGDSYLRGRGVFSFTPWHSRHRGMTGKTPRLLSYCKLIQNRKSAPPFLFVLVLVLGIRIS